MMLLSCDSKYNPNLILQYGYDYDFLGQLISADYANATISDESYTYDENGNRIVANGSTYTTSTNNELTSDGAYTYTYDDEGNRISKTNSTNCELYEWDYRNRLTSVTQQEFNTETQEWTTVQIVEYTYNYNNVWIRKVNGSDKTIFIPENYQTTVQIDNGAVSHHYLWTPNQQDKLLADVTNTEVLWSLTDHLGTIRDIIQSTAPRIVTQVHVIYDAYGNVISCKNSTGETISNPILFAYTGKAFDTSTALQNNINRWYDSTTGRWLSQDPIGFNGSDTNLYRYVNNSPNIYIDAIGFSRHSKGGGNRVGIPNATNEELLEIIKNPKSPAQAREAAAQLKINRRNKERNTTSGKRTGNSHSNSSPSNVKNKTIKYKPRKGSVNIKAINTVGLTESEIACILIYNTCLQKANRNYEVALKGAYMMTDSELQESSSRNAERIFLLDITECAANYVVCGLACLLPF